MRCLSSDEGLVLLKKRNNLKKKKKSFKEKEKSVLRAVWEPIFVIPWRHERF